MTLGINHDTQTDKQTLWKLNIKSSSQTCK